MDYAMPICNGIESTMKIRKFYAENAPAGYPQPFICCLTSYKFDSFKIEALKSGMDGFMTKPIFKAGVQRLLTKAGLLQ